MFMEHVLTTDPVLDTAVKEDGLAGSRELEHIRWKVCAKYKEGTGVHSSLLTVG